MLGSMSYQIWCFVVNTMFYVNLSKHIININIINIRENVAFACFSLFYINF